MFFVTYLVIIEHNVVRSENKAASVLQGQDGAQVWHVGQDIREYLESSGPELLDDLDAPGVAHVEQAQRDSHLKNFIVDIFKSVQFSFLSIHIYIIYII